jgi:hypothetical protein
MYEILLVPKTNFIVFSSLLNETFENINMYLRIERILNEAGIGYFKALEEQLPQ